MRTQGKCSLQFFTWTRVEWRGRKEVTPICPIHPNNQLTPLSFGGGVIITCDVQKHHVNHCTFEQYKAEQEQARAALYPELGK